MIKLHEEHEGATLNEEHKVEYLRHSFDHSARLCHSRHCESPIPTVAKQSASTGKRLKTTKSLSF